MTPEAAVTIPEPQEPFLLIGIVLAAIVGVAYVVLLLIGMSYQKQVDDYTTQISAVDTQLQSKELVDAWQSYKGVETVIKDVDHILATRYLFTENWNTIKSKTPKDVQISNLSMGADQSFYVSGLARSATTVANFAKALEDPTTSLTAITPLSVTHTENNTFMYNMSFKKAKAGGTK